MSRLIAVAVPVPALDALTYSVPEPFPIPAPGVRVLVPLGPRVLTACVLGPATQAPPEVRDVIEILDDAPFLPGDVLDLALWVADYYMAGPGDAMAVAMPPMALNRPARGTGSFKTIRVATLTATGRELAAARERLTITKKQHAALDALIDAPDGLSLPALAMRGVSADTVARLAAKGYVAMRRERVDRDPFAGVHPAALGEGAATPPNELTAEQQAAVAALVTLAQAQRYRAVLLHGVTGSGKTEVYLRTAEAVVRDGRGVLVLVPEIGLTPAVAAAFRHTFGDAVAIQHSGLSDGERHDQWHRIRRADVRIVVGTRSAVFAPVANLGLIVVDEEHDTSYKQEESPRYHGRDVAVMRASRGGALVILGSATPAMETFANADRGRYGRLTLPRRVLDRPLASVRVVDMRAEYAAEGPDVVLSAPLREALEACVRRGEQALVLLNRRGYASAVFCRQCAATIECPNCSVSLTVHLAARRARCHYCDYAMRVPTRCTKCGGQYLELTGIGTERVEADVRDLLPSARVARLDRDTVRRRGAVARLLERVRARELDVLVGTQMIAKGHDFPAVTLVGVISADVGLGLADFRAAERTFQLLTQVSGRAGRGDLPGEAIVQTLFPQHYSIRHGCRQDYAAFYDEESRFRRAMRYPPEVSLINVVVKGREQVDALEHAGRLVRRLRDSEHVFRVLGPAPAPLGRLRGDHRVQFFIKGHDRGAMRDALRQALDDEPDARRRAIVDVDPLSVL